MKITIIAVGKQRTEYYDSAITQYLQRITKPYHLSLHMLNPAKHIEPAVCIERESQQLLDQCEKHEYVIVLDERGRDITTSQLSQRIDMLQNQSVSSVACIIGGSYGFDDRIRNRADIILRLSSLTLPHEMARLILVEQLYRATNILSGGKYHHE